METYLTKNIFQPMSLKRGIPFRLLAKDSNRNCELDTKIKTSCITLMDLKIVLSKRSTIDEALQGHIPKGPRPPHKLLVHLAQCRACQGKQHKTARLCFQEYQQQWVLTGQEMPRFQQPVDDPPSFCVP